MIPSREVNDHFDIMIETDWTSDERVAERISRIVTGGPAFRPYHKDSTWVLDVGANWFLHRLSPSQLHGAS